VFGHSGVVTCNQQSYLKMIPNYNEVLFNNLQKAALLRAIEILRSVNIGHSYLGLPVFPIILYICTCVFFLRMKIRNSCSSCNSCCNSCNNKIVVVVIVVAVGIAIIVAVVVPFLMHLMHAVSLTLFIWT